MKENEFIYEYPYSKAHLLNKLNHRCGRFHYWNDGDYLIEIKSENSFFLGVERGGHSSGYWYVAQIEENSIGTLTIRGKIVYNPDDDGYTKKESRNEKIEFYLLSILLLPFILIAKLIQGVRNVYFIINKKPLPRPSTEEKLDRFMITYLCCKRI